MQCALCWWRFCCSARIGCGELTIRTWVTVVEDESDGTRRAHAASFPSRSCIRSAASRAASRAPWWSTPRTSSSRCAARSRSRICASPRSTSSLILGDVCAWGDPNGTSGGTVVLDLQGGPSTVDIDARSARADLAHQPDRRAGRGRPRRRRASCSATASTSRRCSRRRRAARPTACSRPTPRSRARPQIGGTRRDLQPRPRADQHRRAADLHRPRVLRAVLRRAGHRPVLRAELEVDLPARRVERQRRRAARDLARRDRRRARRHAAARDRRHLQRRERAAATATTASSPACSARATPCSRPSQRARIPGALDAGSDVGTKTYLECFLIFCTSKPSDIAQDFRIDPAVNVVVPAGAQYLFVAPLAPSQKWGDNSGFGFGVNVEVNP